MRLNCFLCKSGIRRYLDNCGAYVVHIEFFNVTLKEWESGSKTMPEYFIVAYFIKIIRFVHFSRGYKLFVVHSTYL